MIKRNKPPKKSEILFILAFSIAVIIGAYILSPTNSHYNPENKHSADKSYSDSDIVASIPDNSKPLIPSVSPYTEKEKEDYVASRSDLAAQWAMAHYTFVGLIVGVIGIILIVLTFYQSRQAAHFAEQALSETKDNSKREIRAYLSVEIIAINPAATQTPTIAIRLKNRGASPAINIMQHIRGHGADDYSEWDITIPPNSDEEIVWPLEGLSLNPKSEPEFFKLKINYSDIFDGDRWIKCNFYVGIESFPMTNAILSQRIPGVALTSKQISTMLVPNPSHVAERKMRFSFYQDDLQKEAKEYAEANKTS